MPNRNSGLAELAQMMQLVNGGGQDNAAAQQQHAGLQWMQLQQQQQQRAAEQEFRQQQLELQKQHYGNERDYQEGMLRGHENAARTAAQERRAATIGRVLDQHLGSGGKLTDFIGQGLMQSLDPESAKLLTQGVAQSTAQKQLALLEPFLMANAVNPKDKKTHGLIRNQMAAMGSLDPIVQQYIPWDSLNQRFFTGAAAASYATADPEIQKALEENPDLAIKMNEQQGRERILRENAERKSADEKAKLRRWALERRLAPLPDPVPQF